MEEEIEESEEENWEAEQRQESLSEKEGPKTEESEDEYQDRKADELVHRIKLGNLAPPPSDSDKAKLMRLKEANLLMKKKLMAARERAQAKPSALRGVFKMPKRRKEKVPEIWRPYCYPCPSCETELPAVCTGAEKSQNFKVKVETSKGDFLVYSSREIRLPCPLCLSVTQAVEWQGTSLKKKHLHSSVHYRLRQHLEREHNKKNTKSVSEWRAIRRYSIYLLCKALHDIPGNDSASAVSGTRASQDSPSLEQHPETIRSAVPKAKIPSQQPESPPDLDHFLRWLVTEKGSAESSAKLYSHHVKQYLGFMADFSPENEPSLEAAWDYDAYNAFNKTLLESVTPTTASSYFTAVANVRTFLICRGRAPSDHVNIGTSFKVLSNTISQKRSKYIKATKEQKSSKQSVHAKFYRQIYHDGELWLWFYELVGKMRNEGYIPTQADIKKVVWFGICLLMVGNYKRSGNLGLLKYADVVYPLNKALKTRKKEFPLESVHGTTRRLDRKTMHPAVIRIQDSTKTHELERIVVLRARDQRALLYYGQYVRPKSDSPYFFLDHKGRPLKKVCDYVKAAGDSQGIPELTTNLMRSCAETATVSQSQESTEALVAAQLGHSISMRNRHYAFLTDQKAINAASHLLCLMEEEGESEDKEAQDDFPIDPVRTNHESYHLK